MKRTIFLIVLIIAGTSSRAVANPIMFPMINEVLVDSTDWEIEILTDPYYTTDTLDGWYLTTSDDTAFFQTGIILSEEYTIIAPDSLQSSLTMNPDGDTLAMWDSVGQKYSEIIYGNCAGSTIDAPKSGHSMNVFNRGELYFDSTPTIGTRNDMEGAHGIIQGVITDSVSNPLPDVYVSTGYGVGEHSTDSSGFYSSEVIATRLWLKATKENYETYHSAWYQIFPNDTTALDTIQLIGPTVIVAREPEGIPENFTLSANFPNPFNPSTTFTYELPREDYVRITLYDLNGRHLNMLYSGYQTAGKYTVQWDASAYSSGIYIYELRTSEYVESRKCTLVK